MAKKKKKKAGENAKDQENFDNEVKVADEASKTEDESNSGKLGWGRTEKGETFFVPETYDTAHVFAPSNIGLGSGITGLVLLSLAWLTFFGDAPKWVHICIFAFFRFNYNVGLGVILHFQSHTKFVTRWYERATKNPNSCFTRLLKRLAKDQVKDSDYNPDDYPSAFNAWLVYKNLVNLILVNDGINYVLLGYKCFTAPPDYSFLVIVQYLLGIFLAVFNYWAKVDAHRCIGTYCWYWGDFWYLKNVNLTFDGIFELFPHPMYTVGYSVYYGYSLICRSYTMLFVSLTAHMLQLAFLMLVEEPHIQRTYGSEDTEEENLHDPLYDPKNGLFPAKKDTVFFFSLDTYRSGDIFLLILSMYTTFFAFMAESSSWAVYQSLFWRSFHWIFLGGILLLQSRYESFTRHFTMQGRPLSVAWSNWKRFYNTSLTLNLVSVFCVAARCHWVPEDIWSGHYQMCIWLGVVLILLGFWSQWSTFRNGGEFSWFYGDFFIRQDQFKGSLHYTGIYRFLNNPDTITGYAGLYGIALISQSYEVLTITIYGQIWNMIFLNLVEIPHMNRIYSLQRRDQGPLNKAIKKLVAPEPIAEAAATKEIQKRLKAVKSQASREIRKLYGKLLQSSRDKNSRRRLSADFSEDSKRAKESTSINCDDEVEVGKPLAVHYTTLADHDTTDWIGVYPENTPSNPGASSGKWMFVPPSADGTVTFPPSLLPDEEGVYEVRYHTGQTYDILAVQTILMFDRALVHRSHASPLNSPVSHASDHKSNDKMEPLDLASINNNKSKKKKPKKKPKKN